MGINPKYKLEKNNFFQEGSCRIISFTLLNPRYIIRNLQYNIKIITIVMNIYEIIFYLFKSNKIIYFLKRRAIKRYKNTKKH
jgi:hypothetical protein